MTVPSDPAVGAVPDLSAVLSNGPVIVGHIAYESVAVYLHLAEQYGRKPETARDPVFQFLYRSYYRLDNAGLSEQFKQAYFEELEAQSGKDVVDLREIALRLHVFTTLRGRRSLQFSFVTKLSNLVTQRTPIYDSNVARMFGFIVPSSTWDVDRRLDAYLKFHAWLEGTYREILQTGALGPVLQHFRERFPMSADALTNARVLDFVFWSAGKRGYRVGGWKK
jgi:hypothetical protein